MTPKEMRNNAEWNQKLATNNDDRAVEARLHLLTQSTIWLVGAQLCERLDRILAQLESRKGD